ncbi:MAG: VWA domain-containing protein [Xanthobacteraceae bacterium]|uniref:VWA domain-containing protein n=1 Tax=Pseudolabrys sp. TaxID=1960880 RepID=UPI003D0A6127
MSKDRREPTTANTKAPAPGSTRPEVEKFLSQVNAFGPAVKAGARGRLVFALDATMSRQPTWDSACVLQADMFREAASVGGLDIQLVYFRGLNECRASGWVADSDKLAALMSRITCQGGHTQIGRVLSHAKQENERQRVQALVYVGDAMEEGIDDLCAAAGELGLRGLPVFMFQEGHDGIAESAYREIARLSGGAWCRFDTGAAEQLRDLLRAVAAYAAGGRKALADLSAKHSRGAQLLLSQMK